MKIIVGALVTFLFGSVLLSTVRRGAVLVERLQPLPVLASWLASSRLLVSLRLLCDGGGAGLRY